MCVRERPINFPTLFLFFFLPFFSLFSLEMSHLQNPSNNRPPFQGHSCKNENVLVRTCPWTICHHLVFVCVCVFVANKRRCWWNRKEEHVSFSLSGEPLNNLFGIVQHCFFRTSEKGRKILMYRWEKASINGRWGMDGQWNKSVNIKMVCPAAGVVLYFTDCLSN